MIFWLFEFPGQSEKFILTVYPVSSLSLNMFIANRVN